MTLPPGTIRSDHLWKRFRADTSRPLFRDQIVRVRNRVAGRPGDWTYVLRDVNLHIEPGESVALVGLNGSGKSTLLKTLSRVMYPTAGSVQVSGRVGALIEVRAGIHPDLTGRENIFFYGIVLGLTRREVSARFDDIVEFAELEDAVDRQVKWYSSGMQMRLGFGIAAFLEPDVLLVDEVLAVGDVGFQQRCLERMSIVLQQGTTLVFVSHDTAAVQSMCNRAVWLDDSLVRADGPVSDVLDSYRMGMEERAVRYADRLASDPVQVTRTAVTGRGDDAPFAGGPTLITLDVEAEKSEELNLCVGVTQGPAATIFMLQHRISVPAGHSELHCTIPSMPLPYGRYFLWGGAFDDRGNPRMRWHPLAPFDVEGAQREDTPKGVMLLSPVYVAAEWETRRTLTVADRSTPGSPPDSSTTPEDQANGTAPHAAGPLSSSHAPAPTLAAWLDRVSESAAPFTFVDNANGTSLTIADLVERSRRVAAGLRQDGVRQGQRLLIATGDQQEFMEAFLACLWAGVTAVPLAVPHMASNQAAYLDNLRRFARVSEADALCANRRVAEMVDADPLGIRLVTADPEGPSPLGLSALSPADVALIQFTSGSTSLPKGVVVTHDNLVANITAIGRDSLHLDATVDRAVSWLPLHHDMGLIGMFLTGLFYEIPSWYLRPLQFLRSPLAWCKVISEVRGSISFAPDFAYRQVAKKVTPEVAAGLDLSSWRIAGCGAEPVQPSTIRAFTEAFEAARFDKKAFITAYGAAENTLAITLALDGPHILPVDAETFRSQGKAAAVAPGRSALEFTSCGPPISSVELDIQDGDGTPVPDGEEGEIIVRGPSVCGGYLNNADETSRTFRADGLHTGDRGFMLDGELYVSGRSKDVIILNGRNVHAHDVEWAVATAVGVDAVVAFGCPSDAGEQLVVGVEDRGQLPDDVEARIRSAVRSYLDVLPDTVVRLPAKDFLRTTSGKVQRTAIRRNFIDGARSPGARTEAAAG